MLEIFKQRVGTIFQRAAYNSRTSRISKFLFVFKKILFRLDSYSISALEGEINLPIFSDMKMFVNFEISF